MTRRPILSTPWKFWRPSFSSRNDWRKVPGKEFEKKKSRGH